MRRGIGGVKRGGRRLQKRKGSVWGLEMAHAFCFLPYLKRSLCIGIDRKGC